ncbi:unnamed protein product [Phytophthora fragariaefolia]|uniref:Unnamed protein product n=1 Tax=Phytophthora fragariaefolia TaxID=1490495 RepID=A0A9W6XD66_9STRA|nr:unnamed protein product [Phytophthora fragariaefolia]
MLLKSACLFGFGKPDTDDHELTLRITYEYHDAPTSGHPGREKTYLLLTRGFYSSHQYKWVRKCVRACEVCQRVKPAPYSQAPLRSLPTPLECWQSISMDFLFGLPPDNKRRTGIVASVDRFSKRMHLAAVPAEVKAKQTARLFVDMVLRHHGMPIDIVSDRDPRFTARFWQDLFTRLGTQLYMSTADQPQTDGQTKRANRVLVDALKSYAHSFHHWSDCPPMAAFAIKNSVHASTGHTPFYVNATRHLRVLSVLGAVAPSLSAGRQLDQRCRQLRCKAVGRCVDDIGLHGHGDVLPASGETCQKVQRSSLTTTSHPHR